MSLRKQTLFLVSITTLVLSLLLAVTLRFLLMDSFVRLEQQKVQQEANSVRYAINRELERLSSIAGDWGPWDDTYLFVGGENPDYIVDNLNAETLTNLELNLFIVLDNEGRIYHAEHNDPITQNLIPLPDGLDQMVQTHAPLLSGQEYTAGTAGLVEFNNRILLIASYPIMNSQFTGPIRGTLLVGRFLDGDLMAKIANSTSLDAAVFRLEDSQQPGSRLLTAMQTNQALVEPIDEETITGTVVLADLTDNPIALVQIKTSRDIHMQGVTTVQYFYTAILLFGLLIGLIIMVGLETRIIARLNDLIHQIGSIRRAGDLSRRVKTLGNDELSILSNEINRTLSSLETSHIALLRNEQRLFYDSRHDSLTNLPNRLYFMDRVNQAIQRTGLPQGSASAVLFIDLDRFKLINDSFNHLYGDQVLVILSQSLAAIMRKEDTIARLGGDEFAVLVEDVPSIEKAVEIAQRTLKAIANPIHVNGNVHIVSASVGIALTAPDARSEDVLRNADIAMYKAKRQGRNCIEVYDSKTHAQNMAELQLEYDLRNAIEKQELCIYYQPILNASEDRVIALEALLRWQHSKLGLLLPGEFLPLAEETGLIVPINDWVLASACQQLRSWFDKGFTHLSVSVNLTDRQLQNPAFPQLVCELLETYQLPGRALRLEVSESVVMAEFELALEIMNRLRALEIRVCIDDFGTGYSSLSYLRRIPATHLKLDKSFIQNLENDPKIEAIVDTIITIARKLNMELVAEGVETEEQWKNLLAKQCDEVQGFLFSHPLPVSEIEDKILTLRTKQP